MAEERKQRTKNLTFFLPSFRKHRWWISKKKKKKKKLFRHPEKNAFEWGDKLHIPHSEGAVEVTHAVGKFFVDGARRNSHGVPDGDVLAEDDLLIYNHPLTFTGRHERREDRPWLDEAYIFPPWETWKRCLRARRTGSEEGVGSEGGGRGGGGDDGGDDGDDDEELCRRYRSPSSDIQKRKKEKKEKKEKRHEEEKAREKSHSGHGHKKEHGGGSNQKKVSLRLAGA